MPEAAHVGSGKVRELYALDDDRLLLVASDRISTFDVVFDLSAYTRHIDTIFERLEALRKEPLNV